DLEGLSVIAAAIARLARDVHRRKKMHFDFDEAIALAFFAAAPFDIEAEAARFVSPDAGGGQAGEKIADVIEHAGVSSRIAARGAADGRLIDHNDFIGLLERFA